MRMRIAIFVIVLSLALAACGTAATPGLETPPGPGEVAQTPAQTDSPVQPTATPSNTPTPIPTSTATLIPSPAISPTPIPLEQLFTTISVPIGGRSCGSLTFKAEAVAQQIAYANRSLLKTNFYTYDVLIDDLPPQVSVDGIGTGASDSQCISTTPAVQPGSYAFPVLLTLYQQESNIPNPQTRTFLAEETYLIHLRVLPPVSGATGLISFVSNQEGNSDNGLYVTNREGSELTRIAGDLYTPAIYAWSPDGTQIAFATREGLFLSDARGQEVVPLNFARPNYISWSPDGQWILAPSYSENPDLFSVDGAQSVKLPRRPADSVWSPDSTRIAYVANPDEQRDLFVIRIDGMQVSQLTDDTTLESNPVWSPDGKWIVYNINSEPDGSLNVISPEGGEAVMLFDSVRPSSIVKWSPDSKKVLFPQGSSGKEQLIVANQDGSDPVSITGEPRSASLNDYAWSPDGQEIVYLDGCEVALVDLNQMQPVVLHEVRHGVCYFSLSPDGQQFLSIGSLQVVIVKADGSGTTVLLPEGLGRQIAPLWQP